MRVELGYLLGKLISEELRQNFPIIAQSPRQFGYLTHEMGGTYAIIEVVHEIGGKLLSKEGENWVQGHSETAKGQRIFFRKRLGETEESRILLATYEIGKTVKEELPDSRVVINVFGKYMIECVKGNGGPPQF